MSTNEPQNLEEQSTDLAKCLSCGNDFFHIKWVYDNIRECLFVVECSACHERIIPVVSHHPRNSEEFHKKCAKAWNEANKIEGVKHDRT